MYRYASKHMILGCDIYNDTFIPTNADTLLSAHCNVIKQIAMVSRGKHLAMKNPSNLTIFIASYIIHLEICR